jgi:hypothetical protein
MDGLEFATILPAMVPGVDPDVMDRPCVIGPDSQSRADVGWSDQ